MRKAELAIRVQIPGKSIAFIFFFFFTKDLRKAKSYHIFHRQLWAGPDYDIFGPRGKLNYPTPLRSHSPTRPPACVLNIFFFTRDIF